MFQDFLAVCDVIRLNNCLTYRVSCNKVVISPSRLFDSWPEVADCNAVLTKLLQFDFSRVLHTPASASSPVEPLGFEDVRAGVHSSMERLIRFIDSHGSDDLSSQEEECDVGDTLTTVIDANLHRRQIRGVVKFTAELFQNAVIKHPSRRWYSFNLFRLCSCLKFYSTRAYEFLRQSLHNTLPHPTTLRSYSSLHDINAGIDQRHLANLKSQSDGLAPMEKNVKVRLIDWSIR